MNTTAAQNKTIILSIIAFIVMTYALSTTTPYTDQRFIVELFSTAAFIGCFWQIMNVFAVQYVEAEQPAEQQREQQPEQQSQRNTVKPHIKARLDNCGQLVYQISFNGVFICEYYSLRLTIDLITSSPTIDTLLRHKRLAYFRQRNTNMPYTAKESRVIISNLITAMRTTIGA